jgi:hypothetical protein
MTDASPASWEFVDATLSLPANTTSVAIQLFAVNASLGSTSAYFDATAVLISGPPIFPPTVTAQPQPMAVPFPPEFALLQGFALLLLSWRRRKAGGA